MQINNKKSRLFFILLLLGVFSTGVVILLINIDDKISFYYTPSQREKISQNKVIRVGGLVRHGSLNMSQNNLMSFVLVDYDQSSLDVRYQGDVPILFREGQGVIVKGQFKENVFNATELLVKHDEKYTPKR